MLKYKKINNSKGLVHHVAIAGLFVLGFAGLAAWRIFDANAATPTKISIASYNILGERFNTYGGYECYSDWKIRYPRVIKQIKSANPDVLSVQEMNAQHVNTKSPGNPIEYLPQAKQTVGSLKKLGYKAFPGVGNGYTPDRSIFWKTSRFTAEAGDIKQTFISGTGDKEAKDLVWVLLKDKKSGKRFYVYNTHLKAGGSNADIKKQVGVIKAVFDARRYKSVPLILTGDFNKGDYDSDGMLEKNIASIQKQLGLHDSFRDALSDYHQYGGQYLTHRGCGNSKGTSCLGISVPADCKRIDHIFIRKAKAYEWQNYIQGQYNKGSPEDAASDHNMIRAKITLQ